MVILAAGAGPLSGQAPEQRSVTLEEALELFVEGNLELRVARAGAAQATGLARQAGAFPNPALNASHEPLSGDVGSYSETYVTASQRVEISGARGARSDAGDSRSRAADERVRADSARLAFEVKRAYVEALRAQQSRETTRRITDVFREAARSATERFQEGDVSLYVLERIRVERARYETLLADAALQVGSAQRMLALLVAPSEASRLAAAPLPSASPPEVEGASPDLAAVERRPELVAARAEVEAQTARARLSRAERIPDVTATGGFKRQSDGLRGAFVGLSVPLFDRRAGAVAAAEAELRAAEERLALTRRQLENDVLQAVESYQTLRERSTLLGEGAAAGETDLLDIALVAYGEGEMELVELLDAADALYRARTAESTLRASLWIAYFDLERALGGFATDSAPGDQP
jgi:cobalt-zinc-cadmium efflux system outer membrane protein